MYIDEMIKIKGSETNRISNERYTEIRNKWYELVKAHAEEHEFKTFLKGLTEDEFQEFYENLAHNPLKPEYYAKRRPARTHVQCRPFLF